MLGLLERWQREQNELRAHLRLDDCVDWTLGEDNPLRLIGGVDISFFPEPPPGPSAAESSLKDDQQDRKQRLAGLACLIVLRFPDLRLVYEDFEPITEFDCPYVPGFLAFREMPAYMTLMDRVSKAQNGVHVPQVVLVDGCGVMHPRKFGSACHLGVVAGIPTIGVAKNVYAVDGLDRLKIESAFEHESEPHSAEHTTWTLHKQQLLPRDMRALRECVAYGVHGPGCAGRTVTLPTGHRMLSLRGASDGELLGAGLAARSTKKPIYVSAGHKVSLESAVCLVSLCCRHRNPEPLRLADLRSREWVRRMAG